MYGQVNTPQQYQNKTICRRIYLINILSPIEKHVTMDKSQNHRENDNIHVDNSTTDKSSNGLGEAPKLSTLTQSSINTMVTQLTLVVIPLPPW